ncbi:hypothetical protein vseg_002031 [Gypsophila vaccaria]
MTYLHDIVSNICLRLCNPSAVFFILATASSGDNPGSKKCSHKNERVPHFSSSDWALWGSPMPRPPRKVVSRNLRRNGCRVFWGVVGGGVWWFGDLMILVWRSVSVGFRMVVMVFV